MSRSGDKKSDAADVWRLLLRCVMTQLQLSSRVTQDLGLTPGHTKALLILERDEPLPMGSLAQQFACDASTMTWIVDRLEERGLVERGGLPSDRRVKTVTLTPLGVRVKADLEDRLYDPPEELLTLDPSMLEALRGVLEKLTERPGEGPAAKQAASTDS